MVGDGVIHQSSSDLRIVHACIMADTKRAVAQRDRAARGLTVSARRPVCDSADESAIHWADVRCGRYGGSRTPRPSGYGEPVSLGPRRIAAGVSCI